MAHGALAAGDVVVGHQVHAVPGGRHDRDVRDAVESNALVKGDRVLQPHYRLVVLRAVPAAPASSSPNGTKMVFEARAFTAVRITNLKI